METDNAKPGRGEQKWQSLAHPELSESAPAPRDSKRLGEAVFDAADVAKGMSHDMEERHNFTPKEIHNYLNDSGPRNMVFLEKMHADRDLRQTYVDIVTEHPELRNIELVKDHRQNACFRTYHFNEFGDCKPSVSFNFDNPDIYTSEKFNEKGDLRGFDSVIAEIALRTGARPSDIVNNRALISSFVLAHEFGHALDFYSNYLTPAIRKARNSATRDGIGVIALPEAIAASNEDRYADIAGMLDAQVEVSGETRLINIFHQRLKSLDIRTPQERKVLSGKMYRTSRSETFADTFAMDFIMSHYDRFFYDEKNHESAKGRVKTNLHGETRTIGDELIPFLDFHAGKKVAVSITPEVGTRTHSWGIMSSSLRVGEELDLNLDGNMSNNSSRNIKKLGRVRNVRMKQDKIDGKAVNTIYLMMTDGSVVEISQMGDGEAPECSITAEDLMQECKLGVGDMVALLKRRVKNGKSSSVGTGDLIAGHLEDSGHGRAIKIGDPIFLREDRNHMFSGGNTSNIRRIYRKWKSYFVETSTSTYEVLPFYKTKA